MYVQCYWDLNYLLCWSVTPVQYELKHMFPHICTCWDLWAKCGWDLQVCNKVWAILLLVMHDTKWLQLSVANVRCYENLKISLAFFHQTVVMTVYYSSLFLLPQYNHSEEEEMFLPIVSIRSLAWNVITH